MSVICCDYLVPRYGEVVNIENLIVDGPAVMTGDQSVAGDQMVGGDINVGGGMTIAGVGAIVGGVAVTGTLNVTGSSTLGSTLNIVGDYELAGACNINVIANATVPTTIVSAGGNQLTVGYNSGNKAVMNVSSAGDFSIDCSGNDIYLAATDTVHVLATTASTSPSSGALVVSGGLGVSSGAAVGPAYVVSTSAPQMTLAYDGSNTATFAVSSGGDMTLDCTGNHVDFANTDTLHVLGTTASSSMTTGALVVSGGIVPAGTVNAGLGFSTNNLITGGTIDVTDSVSGAGFKCSGRYSTSAEYPTGTNGACTVAAGTATITASKIALTTQSDISWPSSASIDGKDTGTYHLRFTPGYTNKVDASVVGLGLLMASGDCFVIIYHNGSGTVGALCVTITNSAGESMMPDISETLSVVSGTEYEILLSWNLAVGAGNACCKVWVNGRLFATGILSDSAGSRSAATPTIFRIISSGDPLGVQPYALRDMAIWTTVTPYWSSAIVPGYAVRPEITAPYIRSDNQLEIYNATKSATLSVDAGGDLMVDCSGHDINFANTDSIHAPGGLTAVKSMLSGGPVGCGGVIVLPATYTGVCTFYASGYRSIDADFTTGTKPLTATTVGSVSLSGGKILIGASSEHRYDFSTSCDGGQTTAVRFKVTPLYSGPPYANGISFYQTQQTDDSPNNAFNVVHLYAGDLRFSYTASDGVTSFTKLYPWSPVSGQEYEFEVNISATLQSLYIDGVRVIKGEEALTRTATPGKSYRYAGAGASYMFRDIMMFDDVQHTTASYTPGYAYNAVDAPLVRVAGRVEIRNATDWESNAVLEVDSTGDLTADCSGNDFNFANTDSVHLLGGGLYLPTTGGTAAPLNYYETSTATAMSVTGPWTEPQLFTLTLLRVGRVVTIGWPSIITTVVGGPGDQRFYITLAAGTIPDRFQPTYDIRLPIFVDNNSAWVRGTILIYADGSITFYDGIGSGFWNAGDGGLIAGSVTYNII